MSDSKLPQIKRTSMTEVMPERAEIYIANSRQGQALLAGGIIATSAALGLLFLTQFTAVSVILAILGLGFFGARQLVKKSLALTSSSSAALISSMGHHLDEVKKQVSKCKYFEHVESEGEQASFQAEQLTQQYKNLLTTLGQKFDPGEITYSRYLGGVEESCLSIGENLMHVRRMLENLNLTKPNKNSPAWLEPKAQIDDILKSNADALLALSHLFNSLNDITTKEKHRDQLEQSMQQIRQLAERAKQYSNKS